MRQHRTVSDLMTRFVIRVHADAGFKDIVKLLSDNDVTAVPVVDDEGRPVGVVSEGDLLRTAAGQPDLTGLLPAPRRDAPSAARKADTTAAGLMTSPAVVAHPEWTVVQAARVMEARGVKRLPVVDERDELVGIVSRADLLRVFLRHDHAIREEISRDVLDRTLGITPADVVVGVREGRVTLRGVVERSSLIPIAVRLCQSVDGVVEVTEALGFRSDDAPGQAGAEPSRRPQPA
ncbi:CBS domain-containing protein [Streptomyces polygonati]|uniref:CBS domain-containing protein n=1 Tax=Streptomyces polygonati TaxID=1617087 RepID=A0ABV8HMH8_9ACTN